ncbi:hypothetical protein BD408DRAFT_427056 [Parasitella parasitica]|nr:hypothetical protein BD408DRAFT_427056 [Parasitella parasitica]
MLAVSRSHTKNQKKMASGNNFITIITTAISVTLQKNQKTIYKIKITLKNTTI